ncbi:alpha-1D adrenergic receptor [Ambystoma mexicanum]|uniref:alpha-1D adrenergic receptor n=1 Tax=Ambystoma mexicanum TaxID=8296 RepID=UPI0037E92AFE
MTFPDFANASLNGNHTDTNWSSQAGNGSETSGAPWNLTLDSKAIGVGVFLAVFILFAIVGNILVILSVACNRHLQTVTNYFIVNLAMADLLLSTTVLPFSATMEVLNVWAFGRIFCNVWAAVDVLCCTASIMSLCIISIDRYIGVKHSLRYPTIMTERRAGVILVLLWAASMVISIGPLLGWKEPPPADESECSITQEPGYALFSSLCSFYLPLLVILVMYFRIYVVARRTTRSLEAGVKRERNKSMEVVLRIHCRSSVMEEPPLAAAGSRAKGHTFRSSLSVRLLKFSREKKAAKTLAIVVGVFILCWFPFFFVLPLGSFFPSLKPSHNVFKVIFWLGYFNSCFNPIIYPCSSKEFKRAFIRLLKCQCHRRRRPLWRVYDHQWRTSMNSSGRDCNGEPRLTSSNSSFIFNPSHHERASKRRTLNLKGWRMFTSFHKPSSQLKEKMNNISNKIRSGSSKGCACAAQKTEVESVSMAISNDFAEHMDYQMCDLTEHCGLRETDI